MNKCDVRRANGLSIERQKLFEKMRDENIVTFEMSTVTKEGLIDVRDAVNSSSVSPPREQLLCRPAMHCWHSA